jgi:hypothetical protein
MNFNTSRISISLGDSIPVFFEYIYQSHNFSCLAKIARATAYDFLFAQIRIKVDEVQNLPSRQLRQLVSLLADSLRDIH